MSWSVSAIGKPAAVKAALAPQFQRAKDGTANIAAEQAAVAYVEAAVNVQLDFLAGGAKPPAVQVTASGSARSDGSASEVRMEVKTLHGFVE